MNTFVRIQSIAFDCSNVAVEHLDATVLWLHLDASRNDAMLSARKNL